MLSKFSKNVLCLNKLIESLNDKVLYKVTPYDFFGKSYKPQKDEYMKIFNLIECEKDYRRNIRDASVHTCNKK